MFWQVSGWVAALGGLLLGVCTARGQGAPWLEGRGEILLRDAQLLIVSPAGAYAVGQVGSEEIQANDLVRGGMAWRKPGKDFALHPVSGKVAIRQANGFLRFYEAETGRFLFERDAENSDLLFREEGTAIPVIFALSAGMIPPERGPYEGEVLMNRGVVAARLTTGELVVAEQATGRELLRVLPFVSGNSLGAAPDGTWGGCEALRPELVAEAGGRREVGAWDGRLFSRIFGDPGPAPPGVEVAAGPWKIVTEEVRDGQASVAEWSYWLQVTAQGKVSGRGNLVGLNQVWASGKDRGTWSGLRLRIERSEGRGSSEEMAEGEILRRPEWCIRFSDDGRTFEGREVTDNGVPIAIKGQFTGDAPEGAEPNIEGNGRREPVNLPERADRPRG